jgi:hypothetical protein
MDPIYAKAFMASDVDFNQVRDGRRSPLFYADIDLSTARSIAAGTNEIITVAGDSFYSDLDPVNQGDAVVTFEDTNLTAHGAPVYVARGQIVSVPFTRLLIENAAQPGKRMRFFYGVGLDFRPGASSSVNVSGTVEVIDTIAASARAGLAYSTQAQCIAGGAGFFSNVALYNDMPGKILRIDRLMLSAVAAGSIVAGMNTWAGFGNPAFATAHTAANKVGGGASAPGLTGCLRQNNSATDHLAAAGTQLQFLGMVQANASIDARLSAPIFLPYQSALMIRPGNFNVELNTWFEFVEEDA